MHTDTHTYVGTTPSGSEEGSSGTSGLIDGFCLCVISTCQTSVTQSLNTNQKHRYGARQFDRTLQLPPHPSAAKMLILERGSLYAPVRAIDVPSL